MDYLLVKHKVADYSQWKKVFEANGSEALESGLTLEHVFRDTADLDMVFVLCKITDFKKAKAFTQKPRAEDSAKKGSVIGTPEGWWLNKEDVVWMRR